MSLTVVDLKTTFRFDVSPKTFKFEDTTNYGSQGVGENEVTGVIKVVDPAGNTHYNNTNFSDPDIDPDVSKIGVKTVSLPLLADGTVIQGKYVITYTVRVSSTTASPAYDISVTKNLTLTYVSPTISLTLTSDCVKPLLKSSDDTSYRVNAVDPVIVRAHKLIYPASLAKADVTGTGATLETNIFYTIKNSTLQHSSKLTSTLTYTYAADFIVTDEITGSAYNEVSCDAQLCDIYCCLRAEWNRYETYKNTNKLLAERHLANWHQMIGLAEKIRIALDCGKGSHVSGYVTTIQALGNCESGCGCDDGTPTLVTGLGGGTDTVIVESGGTPVEVIKVVSGTTTTYSVKLAAATATKITNSYNTTVTAGTSVTITTTTDASGNKDYKINFTDTTVEPDILSFIVSLAITSTSPPVITVSDVSKYGSAFQSPTVSNSQTTQANWLARNNCFNINTFWLAQGAKNYKAHIDILETTFSGKTAGCDTPNIVQVEMTKKASTQQDFRFVWNDGTLITGKIVNFFTNIKLAVTLTA